MIEHINNLKKFRPLLYELVSRDVKIKYRKSVLGVLWTLLNPLLMMVILSVVFSNLMKFDIENYSLYILTGQILFTFYNEATFGYAVYQDRTAFHHVFVNYPDCLSDDFFVGGWFDSGCAYGEIPGCNASVYRIFDSIDVFDTDYLSVEYVAGQGTVYCQSESVNGNLGDFPGCDDLQQNSVCLGIFTVFAHSIGNTCIGPLGIL